jgi:hypothetical protein
MLIASLFVAIRIIRIIRVLLWNTDKPLDLSFERLHILIHLT